MTWMNEPKGGAGMGPNMMQDMMHKGMGMCKEVMDNSMYATPEIRALFEDWSLDVEKQIIGHLADEDNVDVNELADKVGVSLNSLFFFLTRLANKGKIRVQDVKMELIDPE
ncbi:hypothetical protein SAMN05920897_1352 [Alkalispirochaeta americana]|uniref:Winged helix-turn-helix DNA-binding n=1 Tax=Alkalispirochaeta americana TaxID=159291 RepID=A0A1N6XZQ9_9SPIO|nr:winged helix-turn-helix domain-containing protein [Alkalispirochaeta americana]SIR07721.1 hypothetical protein SAMN05920897_1352 [Alkalispirochaeta americana]